MQIPIIYLYPANFRKCEWPLGKKNSCIGVTRSTLKIPPTLEGFLIAQFL